MSKFFARFFVPIVILLVLLTVSVLYYHNIREERLAVMHQQGAMRNINESVYDLVRIRGEKSFNDSCAVYLRRYVANYDKRGLRVTIISPTTGAVMFDSYLPAGETLLANHSERPEVIQAIREGVGYDVSRPSSVDDRDYFYVATYHSEYDFLVRSSLPYELVFYSGGIGSLLLLVVAGIIIAVVLYLIYRIMKLAGSSDFATQKLQQHLRIAQEGVAVFDSHRRLVFANPLFSEYADLVSSTHLEKIEDILRLPEFRKIKRFIENKGYINNNVREFYVSDKAEINGRIFALRGVLFADNSFEISINDITTVEEQTRLKRQLTQNVAHEFKTPVCSIQGYLETILQNYPDNITPEQMHHFLERCYSQSTRLDRLVQDISQLNEITGGVQRVHKEPVDLSALVNGLLQEVNNKVEDMGMAVENLLPSSVMLLADSSMLYSIFRNLFDNAIAYAGEGATVKISCFRTDESFYYFSFSDNGGGVPEECLPRLFERFYRVDKGRSRKLGGTGLGLAIVKNAVLLHGGTISARNTQGGGLEFIFKLKR